MPKFASRTDCSGVDHLVILNQPIDRKDKGPAADCIKRLIQLTLHHLPLLGHMVEERDSHINPVHHVAP